MPRPIPSRSSLAALLLAAGAVACSADAPPTAVDPMSATMSEAATGSGGALGRTIYGLDDRNTLVVFDGDRPGDVARRVPITGATGELVGLDFRPNDATPANGNQTGLLYALSTTGTLYTVDPATGAATAGATLTVPPGAGAAVGMGFNPVADRLRLHTEGGQNLRVDVETGATTVDGALAYAAGDPNAGRVPALVATAYTNSVTPAPATTALYAIDVTQDALVTLDAPNGGQLRTVGRLVVDNGTAVGFDIPGQSAERLGYATFTPPRYTRSFLYRVNLDDASRTPIGPVGHDRPIISLAIDDRETSALPAMSFFVTSTGSGNGGDLGGLAGADATCQQRAATVGAGDRTWRAYLSTSAADGQPAIDARDRIGRGPWYNVRGALVARNLDELHAAAPDLTKETALTERGEIVTGVGDTPPIRHDILTGSRPDGTAFPDSADHTCGNWTSSAADGTAQVGHSDRRGTGGAAPTSWNSAHASRGCGQQNLVTTGGAGLLYCFVP